MNAEQPALFAAPPIPLPSRIDLRNQDADAMLAELAADGRDTMRPNLWFADPPWADYEQQPGHVDPELQYDTLSTEQIYEHLRLCGEVSAPRARLALWVCWPLLVQWLLHPKAIRQIVPPCWEPKTGGDWQASDLAGSWHKDGAPGTGYHWQGRSEPLLVFVKKGKGRTYTDKTAMVDNGHCSQRGEHSRKPVDWQAQMIRRWCPKSGLVGDLYAGLASVAEATVKAGSGYRYRGAEIDAKRYERGRGYIRRYAL